MSYHLTYFNLKGLAETSRLLLAAAHVEFEDERYPFNATDFSRPEFEVAKAADKFYLNLGSVPVLSYTGPDGSVTLGQSKAIERFLAKKLGYFGANDLEAAQIDMITEHCRDIKQKYADARAGKKDAELDAAKAKFVAESLPTWFGKLEKTLSGTGYAVGSKLSLADIVIFSLVKDYFDDLAGVWIATSETPKIRASCEAAQAAVQHWLAVRPVTKF